MESSPPSTGKGPLANLTARRAAGEIHADPVQEKVVLRLQAIHDQLAAMAVQQPAKPSFLARLGLGHAPKPPEGPHGLYIWGSVGRGKSMLMDLFFADAPVAKKRRVHFHEFMLEVQARLHRRREELAAKGAPPESDTIVPIAREIAAETRLLCFDEFQVTNIADAMILGRLFETLFEEGITVIATSNRAPDDLYKNGLQRDRFLPFIELVKQRLEVLELGGAQDYRMGRLRELDLYLTPLGAWATKKLDEAFRALSNGSDGEPRVLRTQGRDVDVPRAAPGVAMAHFLDWCAKPMGAADFLCIADNFHTVIVAEIPRMGPDSKDKAVRFVTMIDTFYEKKVKFICSAAANPGGLYPEGDGSFEFQRTVSRLMEMQSPEYLTLEHIA
ncbi:MAG: cell division protein ZapE [Reyranella sp.]|uniref:cell division protein ZapE n=1 Tax=Reyranella sp. TaxID=1929291 RepID=UPI001206DD35|nr:cell division protein ZapE [Reyranella sp.]TAJ94777.1 MAG: cell division protein ZapE [Reyranella sp.]TBR26384.1 MAG: cell division protein ZapE [Reyranella sp.]